MSVGVVVKPATRASSARLRICSVLAPSAKTLTRRPVAPLRPAGRGWAEGRGIGISSLLAWIRGFREHALPGPGLGPEKGGGGPAPPPRPRPRPARRRPARGAPPLAGAARAPARAKAGPAVAGAAAD